MTNVKHEEVLRLIDKGLGQDYRSVYEAHCLRWCLDVFSSSIESKRDIWFLKRFEKRLTRDSYLSIGRFVDKDRKTLCIDNVLKYITDRKSAFPVKNPSYIREFAEKEEISLSTSDKSTDKLGHIVVELCEKKRAEVKNLLDRSVSIRNHYVAHHADGDLSDKTHLNRHEFIQVIEYMAFTHEVLSASVLEEGEEYTQWKISAEETGRCFFEFLENAGYTPDTNRIDNMPPPFSLERPPEVKH